MGDPAIPRPEPGSPGRLHRLANRLRRLLPGAGAASAGPEALRAAHLRADVAELPQVMELAERHLRDVNSGTEAGALAVLEALGQLRDHSGALLADLQARRERAGTIAAERTRRLAGNAKALDDLRRFQAGRADRTRADGARIGEVLDGVRGLAGLTQVIRDLANRTELLALNAAIEAAHAGASGRGFAVVAQEVRALSQQAGSATEQIDRELADLEQLVTGNLTALADRVRQEAEPRQVQILADGFAEVDQAYDEACGYLAEAADRACAAVRGIHGDVVEALGHLQFQDVVRQEVDYVVLLLDTLSRHFASADGPAGEDGTSLAERLEGLRAHHVMHRQRATHDAVLHHESAADAGPAIELF